MNKLNPRIMILGLLVAGVVSSILVFLIPVKYTFSQSLDLDGQVSNMLRIPIDIKDLARDKPKLLSAIERSNLKCQPAGDHVARCTGWSKTKSDLEMVGAFFMNEVSQQFGWLDRPAYIGVIEIEKQNLEAQQSEISGLDEQLETLKYEVGIKALPVDQVSSDQAKTIAQISDKKQQLKLIEDAIPDETNPEVITRFKLKAEELKKSIEADENALGVLSDEAEAALKDLPQAQGLLEDRSKLVEEKKITEKKIADFEYDLLKNPDSNRFADPDGFRISSKSKPKISSVRTWNNIPWSFGLPSLLFGLVLLLRRWLNKKSSSDTPSEPITSSMHPKEISELLGIPYLGKLDG